MKVTVDASIVIKWFVAEAMSDEARLLLSRRIHLQAPEFLLVEFANTIWKKKRRGELPDAQPYLEELAGLPDILTLHRDGDLVERAISIAMEMDHPIYDCLYLACAESTESDLITADKHFVDKVVNRFPGAPVRHISARGVADWIEAAATAPVIERETVERLIAAYEVFAKTKQFVLDNLSNESEGFHPVNTADLAPALRSPSLRHLLESLIGLNDEERIDLLALGWLGAGLFPNWRQSVEHAEKMVAGFDPRYAAGYGRHWQAGYKRVTGGNSAV